MKGNEFTDALKDIGGSGVLRDVITKVQGDMSPTGKAWDLLVEAQNNGWVNNTIGVLSYIHLTQNYYQGESISDEYDPSGEPDIISEDDQKLLDYFNHIEGKEAYGEREEYEELKKANISGLTEEELDGYYERMEELRISLGEAKAKEVNYDTTESWWSAQSQSDKKYVLDHYIFADLTGTEDGLDWDQLTQEVQDEVEDYFGEKIFSQYHGEVGPNLDSGPYKIYNWSQTLYFKTQEEAEDYMRENSLNLDIWKHGMYGDKEVKHRANGEATGLDDPWTRGMSKEEKKAYHAIDSGDCCETPEDIDRLADREGISRDVVHKVFNNNFSYEGDESYANEEDIFTWISTKLGLKPRKQTTYGPKEIPDNRPKEKQHLCSPSEIYDHKSRKCIPKYMAPWKLRNESYAKERERTEDIYNEMLRIVDPDMTGDVNTGYGQSMISDMAQKHNLSEYQIQEIWDSGGTTDIDVSNETHESEFEQANEEFKICPECGYHAGDLKSHYKTDHGYSDYDAGNLIKGDEEIIEKKPPKIEYMYYKQYPLGRRANVKSHFGKEVSIRTLKEAENWWGQVRVKQGYPAWKEMNIINRQRAISDYLRTTVFRESHSKEVSITNYTWDDMGVSSRRDLLMDAGIFPEMVFDEHGSMNASVQEYEKLTNANWDGLPDHIRSKLSGESYAKEFIEIEEWWTNIGNSRRFELLEKHGYSQSNNFYEDWRFDDLPEILQSALSLDYEGNESYSKEQNGAGGAGGNGAGATTGNGGEPAPTNGNGEPEEEEKPSRRIGFGYGRYRNCPKGQVYRDGKCVDEAKEDVYDGVFDDLTEEQKDMYNTLPHEENKDDHLNKTEFLQMANLLQSKEGESNLKGNTAEYSVSYYRPDVGGDDDTQITGWNELKSFSKRVGGISRVINVYRNGKELETTSDDLRRLQQEANEGGRGSGKRGHSGWMKSLEEASDYKECPNCKVMTEQYGGKCQLCGKKV